jgi:hypothetical protein
LLSHNQQQQQQQQQQQLQCDTSALLHKQAIEVRGGTLLTSGAERRQRLRFRRSSSDDERCSDTDRCQRGRLPSGALHPIAAWRRQRQHAACVIQACARGFLCRRRLLQQRRAADAAAAIQALVLSRVLQAWGRWTRLRAALRACLERRMRERLRGMPVLPTSLGAAVLRIDGNWGLATAHCSRSRLDRALMAWVAAASMAPRLI